MTTKKEEQFQRLMERIRDVPAVNRWKVEDIDSFYHRYPFTKKNGMILMDLLHTELFQHDVTYGPLWHTLYESLHEAIRTIIEKTNVGPHNQVRMVHHRRDNAIDLYFLQDGTFVEKRELIYCHSLEDLFPLATFPTSSLEAFVEPYESFYYHHYLDEYVETDRAITEMKPAWNDYKKLVKKDNIEHPFFTQIQQRSIEHYLEKKRVIHSSINEYLQQYGRLCDTESLSATLLASQQNKVYLLWKQDRFEVEQLVWNPSEFQFSHLQRGQRLIFHTPRFSIACCLQWYNVSATREPMWNVLVKQRIAQVKE